ncbi:acyl carrier protein [Myxococcus stipitatus]|uniref:acyl carrier protein n=1 Tax=Myxococcus stipitatus TaxID=83455 RepID=UPI0030D4489E
MSIRDRIRGFIVDTFFVDDFADNDSFLRKGLIDSTGMMELVAFLESDFGIKLEDKELVPENLDSLARVVAFVERKQQPQRLPQAG